MHKPSLVLNAILITGFCIEGLFAYDYESDWRSYRGNECKWAYDYAQEERPGVAIEKIEPTGADVYADIGETVEITFYYNYNHHLFNCSFLTSTNLTQDMMVNDHSADKYWCIPFAEEENPIRDDWDELPPGPGNGYIVTFFFKAKSSLRCGGSDYDLASTPRWMRVTPYDISNPLFYKIDASGQATGARKPAAAMSVQNSILTFKKTGEFLNCTSPFSGSCRIAVRDIQGRTLIEKVISGKNARLSVKSISSGTFLIEVSNGHRTLHGAFINR
ncbi:MAG: hypothetical protein GF350_17145 [Chitinivibrionales bacterium]|nr:hypothetical protein [Chitinivibrionales bacterium]